MIRGLASGEVGCVLVDYSLASLTIRGVVKHPGRFSLSVVVSSLLAVLTYPPGCTHAISPGTWLTSFGPLHLPFDRRPNGRPSIGHFTYPMERTGVSSPEFWGRASSRSTHIWSLPRLLQRRYCLLAHTLSCLNLPSLRSPLL